MSTHTALSSTNEYCLISTNEIGPSKTNRTLFDEKKLQELARSIQKVGVKQPISVRPVDGKYEIIAGERRWRAAQLAGLEEMPCLIRHVSDAEALEIQKIENLQREDLDPFEQAEGFYDLLEKTYHGDIDALAEASGWSKEYIYRYLHLCDSVDELKEMYRAGKMNRAMALEICRIPPEQQIQILDKLKARQGGWNKPPKVREIREWIDDLSHVLSEAPFPLMDWSIPDVPACVDCPKRTGYDSLLFADIGGEDRCLDPLCYKTKFDAFLQSKVEANPALVRISTRQSWDSTRDQSALHADAYRVVDSTKCPSTEQGLVVDSYSGKMKAGMEVPICRDSKCTVHANARTGSGNVGKLDLSKGEQRAETIQQNKENRWEESVRRAILEQCVAKHKAPKQSDLVDMAHKLYAQAGFSKDQRLLFFSLLKQEWTKEEIDDFASNARDADQAIAAYLAAKSSAQELYRFMFLVRHFADTQWNHDAKAIESLAKEYGVDAKKIRAQMEDSRPVKKAK